MRLDAVVGGRGRPARTRPLHFCSLDRGQARRHTSRHPQLRFVLRLDYRQCVTRMHG
jgi:hypothetical protein